MPCLSAPMQSECARIPCALLPQPMHCHTRQNNAKAQEWPGRANVSANRLDRRKSKPKDSPTFHVKYYALLIWVKFLSI
jgi:hypothetical protein